MPTMAVGACTKVGKKKDVISLFCSQTKRNKKEFTEFMVPAAQQDIIRVFFATKHYLIKSILGRAFAYVFACALLCTYVSA